MGNSSSLFDMSKELDGKRVTCNRRNQRYWIGGLNILVNSVGGSSSSTAGALALSDEDWIQTFNANLFSSVRLNRGFLPAMVKHHKGMILSVTC